MTANKAVLDYASRHRQHLLYNIWLMGKNAIERGNRDHWTITPKIVEAAKNAKVKKLKGLVNPKEFARLFRDPAKGNRAASSCPPINRTSSRLPS